MSGVNYGNVRILLIEDHQYSQNILVDLLNSIGIEKVDLAFDGEEGFKRTLLSKPDIVLCDIKMEPVDGIEFLKRLRLQAPDGVRDLPVIMISSDSDQDTVIEAARLGIGGYLVKPVKTNELKAKIDAAFAQSVK